MDDAHAVVTRDGAADRGKGIAISCSGKAYPGRARIGL